MTQEQAINEARRRDLKAKRGEFFKAEKRGDVWCVLKFDCETEKTRVVAR